ncbi:hypothetical protein [Xanthobacter sediminis]
MMRYIIFDGEGRIIGHMTSSSADDEPPCAMDGQHVMASDDGGEATHYVAGGEVLERPVPPPVAPAAGMVGEPVVLCADVPAGTVATVRPTQSVVREVGGVIAWVPPMPGTFRVRVTPPWPQQEATFTFAASPGGV